MDALKKFSTLERVQTPYLHIDPGFINKRLIFSVFGSGFVKEFNRLKQNGDDHWADLSNNHLIVDLVLASCNGMGVKSLGEILFDSSEDRLFCSTEKIEGSNDVYEDGRKSVRIDLSYEYEKEIKLSFGTEHFVATTGRAEVAEGAILSIIGVIREISSTQVTIWPLIIGAPSFDHSYNDDFVIELEELIWYGWHWYEIFPEDITEFSRIKEMPDPATEEWVEVMRETPENSVKEAFCEILGDVTRKDWGGELADHFSSSVHLANERLTAAFLLKGPARFREMTPEMLGKRADQIYRLSQTPAQLLIVQHSHQIGEAVRATLRAFSVTPHNPRRYCFINGKDTYKILQAYEKI
jgi:hypothetical protein